MVLLFALQPWKQHGRISSLELMVITSWQKSVETWTSRLNPQHSMQYVTRSPLETFPGLLHSVPKWRRGRLKDSLMEKWIWF
jgi:hypothetical protein